MDARQLNSSIEDTIAYKINALNGLIPERKVLFSGVSNGISYMVSVYGRIGIVYAYADNSIENEIPSGGYYTIASGKIIPMQYMPKENTIIYNTSFTTIMGGKRAIIGINASNGWFGFGWVYDKIETNDKFYAQHIWTF